MSETANKPYMGTRGHVIVQFMWPEGEVADDLTCDMGMGHPPNLQKIGLGAIQTSKTWRWETLQASDFHNF